VNDPVNNRAETQKDSIDLDKPFPPGVLELALADFAKAIELQPKNAALYSNRGVAKRMKKDLQGARLDFDKAIALDSSDATFYANEDCCSSNWAQTPRPRRTSHRRSSSILRSGQG